MYDIFYLFICIYIYLSLSIIVTIAIIIMITMMIMFFVHYMHKCINLWYPTTQVVGFPKKGINHGRFHICLKAQVKIHDIDMPRTFFETQKVSWPSTAKQSIYTGYYRISVEGITRCSRPTCNWWKLCAHLVPKLRNRPAKFRCEVRRHEVDAKNCSLTMVDCR